MATHRVPRWLFGWTDRFTDTWGSLPAVPVLYAFMLCGTLQIMTRRGNVTVQVHVSAWISDTWRCSSLLSPLLVGLAWHLVTHHSGRKRLIGLYLRFAGDFGQAVALGVFLIIRLSYSPVNDDAHIFLMWIVGGVFAFVCMLVARDLWILRRVQEVAMILERLEKAGIPLEDE